MTFNQPVTGLTLQQRVSLPSDTSADAHMGTVVAIRPGKSFTVAYDSRWRHVTKDDITVNFDDRGDSREVARVKGNTISYPMYLAHRFQVPAPVRLHGGSS